MRSGLAVGCGLRGASAVPGVQAPTRGCALTELRNVELDARRVFAPACWWRGWRCRWRFRRWWRAWCFWEGGGHEDLAEQAQSNRMPLCCP